MTMTASPARIVTTESLDASDYRVPMEEPESDGALRLASAIVVAETSAGRQAGIGFTHADGTTAVLIKDILAPIVVGREDAPAGFTWARLISAIRHLGRSGIAAIAISAVADAPSDLRARFVRGPLAQLLGVVRARARRTQALCMVEAFTQFSVTGLEEPVYNLDFAGLRDSCKRYVPLEPGLGRPGNGLEFKRDDAGRYAV